MIHYDTTEASGSINPPIPLDLISDIGLRIYQPEPNDPHGSNICFMAQSDLHSNPKHYMAWEIISSRGQYNVYKFILERRIGAGQWAEYFSDWVEVYLKAKIDQGKYKMEDVYKFEDIFHL